MDIHAELGAAVREYPLSSWITETQARYVDGAGSQRDGKERNGLDGIWRRFTEILWSPWHWWRSRSVRTARRMPTGLGEGSGGAVSGRDQTPASPETASPAAEPVEAEPDGAAPEDTDPLASPGEDLTGGETISQRIPESGHATEASGRPRARGGERGRRHRGKHPVDREVVRSSFAGRMGQVEIVCRERSGRWELAVVPRHGVVVRGADGQPASATREFVPASFRSEVHIEDVAGGEIRNLRLYMDKPMVFQVGTDWRGPGRKVRGVGVGHFVAIVPMDWTRWGKRAGKTGTMCGCGFPRALLPPGSRGCTGSRRV